MDASIEELRAQLERCEANSARLQGELDRAVALGRWCAAKRDRLRFILGGVLEGILGADIGTEKSLDS